MNLLLVSVRNVRRNWLRTSLTIAGISVAILTFMLLRTVLSAWTASADHAAKDRVGTRHKVGITLQLPRRYVQEIRGIPGVQSAASASWFGGKDPRHPNEFFGSFAVEPKEYLDVYDEVSVPEEQRQSWFQNKAGAVVGDLLASKMGWKVGDRVTLSGTLVPGDWDFTIAGIYTATRKSIDRSAFLFHYDYLNDSPLTSAAQRDLVGWIVSRIDNPGRSAEISKAIDARFDEHDIQTLSMSERAMNASFIGMLGAILDAVDVVSFALLLIMGLMLGNTVAMSVRERTHEYGVLRAIGFLPVHLALFVLGEAVAMGVAGGVVGVAVSYPFVNVAVGRFLEENMGSLFPFFRIAPATTVSALLLSAVLGIAAALQPAHAVTRLKVIEALRRID